MKLYFPLDIDLYNPSPMPVMEAQQNNIGRGALVTLKANGSFISLDGESVQLYAKKPDGTISYLPCTISGSQIQCDFTNQMLALPGMVQVELQMIGGTSGNETEITTPIFCVKVNPSNVDDSAVESQDEFPALVTALAEVAELKANGLKGDPGEAATIQVGTVTASDPGSEPQVTNSGTEQDAVLNFVLPRGPQGPQGIPGEGVTFGAYSSFPNPGHENVLYVDNTVNPMRAYVWNGEKYVPAGGAAADVSYDNESSGLTAQTVQEAIDENAQNISSLNSSLGSWSRVISMYLESNKTYDVELPENKALLLAVENTYGVGCLYFVQTALASENRDAATYSLGGNPNYFKVESISGQAAKVKVTSGEASGTLKIYSF